MCEHGKNGAPKYVKLPFTRCFHCNKEYKEKQKDNENNLYNEC